MSIRLELTVYGGKADSARVDAKKLATLLEGVSKDIVGVCRNISADDAKTPWEASQDSCTLYVVGLPQKGKSVSLPLALEDSSVEWGAISARRYVEGLAELRSHPPGSEPFIPPGFDLKIIQRVAGYKKVLGDDYKGLNLSMASDGDKELSATMDRKLFSTAEIQVILSEKDDVISTTTELSKKVFGHSIQGVLYELNDRQYDDPGADLVFEVDTHDGQVWVCKLPKERAPEDIQELWRTQVVVEGTATLRPRKPEMAVDFLLPLGESTSPLTALEELIDIYKGRDLLGGKSLQEAMDDLRERH